MDPLIGLVNQIQMIRDLTSAPLLPSLAVWFSVWPVGGAVQHPFLPVGFNGTQKQPMPLVRGQQTKELVKNKVRVFPVGLI